MAKTGSAMTDRAAIGTVKRAAHDARMQGDLRRLANAAPVDGMPGA